MARDSSATKARLLDSAFAEFAAYGIAGARVDRIAEAAQANKRLIYVYYGNKEQLFDAVLQRALETGSESVPFDAEDLPGYVGAVFDHLAARPDLMRLMQWKQLERPGTTDAEAESYRGKIAAVERAQGAGLIDPGLDPADLLALVMGMAGSWTGRVGGVATGGPGAAWPPERLARHRETVVESVRRLIRPPRTAG
ncbi:TetR family transcriptional regulator [Streptomyces sp. ISL-43]|uniref:TetR/AcrR family transcriptional regulator n=1 Tax=Streptomyces sp. ISL-43 TaxID=2819183 RepID=UPI001BE6F26C|nr:TetR family transcriptional regulator [Streptomyces sp. ISL-43]MBT2452794.1 TetR family transcriptional regulator [Streptomyces sp. ISL-43]